MERNEIRLGNWLTFSKESSLDAPLNESKFVKILNGELEINPIPLTEEWLLKLDFEEEYRSQWTIKFTHKNSEFGYDWNKTFGWRARYFGHHIDCKYVHQLQNIYFTLSGKELKIKEKVLV